MNSVILSGKYAEKSALDLAEGKVNFFQVIKYFSTSNVKTDFS